MIKAILNAVVAGCLLIAQQSSTPRVELSLIVTDKAHKSLDAVPKEDVRVFEDGIEQTVLSVEPDERPVDYGLVIDTSGSFRSTLPVVLEVAKWIIVNRRPSDGIFIEKFVSTDKIRTIHDFSTNTDALVGSLALLKVEPGQSAVIDAVYTAVSYVAQHNKSMAGRRKAVVLITDGEDRDSAHSREALKELLRQTRVQVFVLGFTSGLDKDAGPYRKSSREKAEKLLTTIAEESGGRVFFLRNEKEVINATAEIASNLRRQFRVAYQSSNNAATKDFRKIEVKLNSPKGEKRHAIVPPGYYVQ